MLDSSKREKYLYEIIETLTARTAATRGDADVSLNLLEYIFLRKAAIAWKQCSGQTGLIQRSQIQTCASQIMLSK